MAEVPGKGSNLILQALMSADADKRRQYLLHIEEKIFFEISCLRDKFLHSTNVLHLTKMQKQLELIRHKYFCWQKKNFEKDWKRYQDQTRLNSVAIIKEMWSALQKQFTKLVDAFMQNLKESRHLIHTLKLQIQTTQNEIIDQRKMYLENVNVGIANIETEILRRHHQPYLNNFNQEYNFGTFLISLLKNDFDAFRQFTITQDVLARRVEEKEKIGFLTFLKEKNISQPVPITKALIQHKNLIQSNVKLGYFVEKDSYLSEAAKNLDSIKKLQAVLELRQKLLSEALLKEDLCSKQIQSLQDSQDTFSKDSPPNSMATVFEIASSLYNNVPFIDEKAISNNAKVESKDSTRTMMEYKDNLIETVDDLLKDEEEISHPLTPSIATRFGY